MGVAWTSVRPRRESSGGLAFASRGRSLLAMCVRALLVTLAKT